MSRHKVTYDKAVKETPEWKFLYNKWCWLRKRPHSEEFKEFQAFHDWSLKNGFVMDAKLERLHFDKPYSPENCQWVQTEIKQRPYTEEEQESISRFNETVNSIRRYYGMAPIGQKGDQQ